MAHPKRLVMFERSVLLVSVEAADGASLVEQMLREQRAHERLADAALSLQNEMNRVLHRNLTSKDRECHGGCSRMSGDASTPPSRSLLPLVGRWLRFQLPAFAHDQLKPVHAAFFDGGRGMSYMQAPSGQSRSDCGAGAPPRH